MRTAINLTIVCLMAITALSVQAGVKDEERSSISSRNFDISVSVSKKRRMSGSDYDNKAQTLDVTIRIENRSGHDEYKGLKLKVYLIGESATTNKHYRILTVNEHNVDLALRERKEIAGGSLRLEYDDNESARFGYKYESYVAVLRDSEGKLIDIKGPKSLFTKNLDELIKLGAGAAFDRKFNKVNVPFMNFSH